MKCGSHRLVYVCVCVCVLCQVRLLTGRLADAASRTTHVEEERDAVASRVQQLGDDLNSATKRAREAEAKLADAERTVRGHTCSPIESQPANTFCVLEPPR